MLKSKITKAEFDALDDVKKGFYKEVNGAYVLDTDEADDLRRTLDAVRAENATFKAEQARLQAEKDKAEKEKRDAEEEAARKKGDVAALEASWQAKVTAAEAKGAADVAALNLQIERLTIDAKANEIATEIGTVPELLSGHIKNRLRLEVIDGVPTVRVKDTSGQPSAQTVEELKKEYIDNPKFAGIIVGSKASGGGASGSQSGGSGGAKKISEMSETERVAHYNKVGQAAFEAQSLAERNGAA